LIYINGVHPTAYNTGAGFPRLERASLPQAIAEAEYSLDVRALSPFAADTSEVLRLFRGKSLS
jgi:hypothetical protein